MSKEMLLALLGVLVPFLSAITVGIWKTVSSLENVKNSIGSANLPNTILGQLHDHDNIIEQLRDWAIIQGFNRRKDH